MSFKPAERKKAKLRLALCGTSGSGKTYSAILIAKGISDKIAMIDTEHHSGELYSDLTKYDVAPLGAPYTPERYISLINDAEKEGYEVLIIDSLSHAWAGEGGVLDMVNKAASANRSQNSYTAWRFVTPEHNRLVEAILKTKMHVICTIRSKTDYETSKDDKGKMQVEKIGLAPVQREGLDYEFTTVLDLSVDGHIAKSSKDRTRIFDGKFIKPSESTGQDLLKWLNSGAEYVDDATAREGEISQYINRINSAENLENLKAIWAEARNKAMEWHYKLAEDAFTDAKNKRKNTLEKQVLNSSPVFANQGTKQGGENYANGAL